MLGGPSRSWKDSSHGRSPERSARVGRQRPQRPELRGLPRLGHGAGLRRPVRRQQLAQLEEGAGGRGNPGVEARLRWHRLGRRRVTDGGASKQAGLSSSTTAAYGSSVDHAAAVGLAARLVGGPAGVAAGRQVVGWREGAVSGSTKASSCGTAAEPQARAGVRLRAPLVLGEVVQLGRRGQRLVGGALVARPGGPVVRSLAEPGAG